MAARFNWLIRSAMLILVLVLALGATALPTEAQDNPGGSVREAAKDKAEKVVSSSDPVSDNEAKKTLKYWTKERMEKAKPVKPVLPGKPEDTPGAGSGLKNAPTPEGQAKKIPGSLPDGEPQASSAQTALTTSGTATATAASYSYPYPYERYALGTSYYTSYPYSTLGRIFFQKWTSEGWKDSSCSGTVVWSENKSVVWTAGHCVHSGRGGSYHRNWMFAPAYKNGTYQLGRWTARSLRTTSGWANYGDFNYDLGAAVVSPSSNGTRLAGYVGSLGLTWNQSYQQNWLDFGYPADYPFNGQWMYYCKAPTATTDSSMGSPYSIGIGCDMTGGASGGAWTTSLSTSGGYVNSVNSYKYDTMPRAMFGTYQGNAAANLYNAVRY